MGMDDRLWNNYVFKRGNDVYELWDQMFRTGKSRLLYIAGRGFDTRAKYVMEEFVSSLTATEADIEEAQLLLVGFKKYELNEEIAELTEQNAASLTETFQKLTDTHPITLTIGESSLDLEDHDELHDLRTLVSKVLETANGYTDIVLDVSSFPRVIYFSLVTSLLNKLIPDSVPDESMQSSSLYSGGINLMVLVGEDAALDAQIQAEDPGDIISVPGFSAAAMHLESIQDWPMAWFPILGEQRAGQLDKIMKSGELPQSLEVCPVLPHPSRDPRRADKLLIEYKQQLFDSRRTLTSNIIYVHESNPFEAYRQLLGAMNRYCETMGILGGCRLAITPLGSKLITLGTALACFEIKKTQKTKKKHEVAILYIEPLRYVVDAQKLRETKPQLSAMLLTGEAYQ